MGKRHSSLHLAGIHRSFFIGQGLEWEESRPFQPGDDIRSVDWRSFGKTGDLYSKKYREERSLHCHFLIDSSSSIKCIPSHHLLMGEILSLLGHTIHAQRDLLSALFCSDHIQYYLPPSRKISLLYSLLAHLLLPPIEKGETDFTAPLQQFLATSIRSSLCFLLSDFTFPPPLYLLRKLEQRHQVIYLHLVTPTPKISSLLHLSHCETLSTSTHFGFPHSPYIDQWKQGREKKWITFSSQEPPLLTLQRWYKKK